jgi:ATP adenylyltransferase
MAQVEDAEDFAGVRDGFQRLWTPHRMAYVRGERPSEHQGEGCPFCTAPERDDAAGLIVHRGRTCYVVLNLFPYNPGHLLVCPYRHVAPYLDLTDEETAELTALTRAGLTALQAASEPAGFNIGMNQGAVAGDMNFLPVVAQTKALPMLLEETRRQLLAAWPTGGVPHAQ